MIPSNKKPKYKALIVLRADVWKTLKNKALKKKKWRFLIEPLKKKKNRYFKKKKPAILNYTSNPLFKFFPLYRRYRYQKYLIIRKRIKLIYGSLQEYKIKSLANKAGRKRVFGFIINLEQMSSVFLYRIKLTSTYGEAKMHFKHKRIIVNGSYKEPYLKKGDVLHFSRSFEKLLRRRIVNVYLKKKRYLFNKKKLKYVIHNNVDFDVGSFRFYFIDNIKYHKNHPFFVPFERIWRWYTRV